MRLIPRFLRVLFAPGFLAPDGKEPHMLASITQKARVAAKAIVAVATPILVDLVVDVMAELSAGLQTAIVAGATGLVVYLVPNKNP